MKNDESRFFQKDSNNVMELSDTESLPPPVSTSSTFRLHRLPKAAAQGTSSAKKTTDEKTELDACLRRAAYEIEHDAYRGMKTLLANDDEEDKEDRIPQSPWQACQFGSAASSSTPISNAPVAVIESIYQCSCPTLQEWCEDIQKKNANNNSKSRKKSSSSTRKRHFGCETNPFCLLSSGGVMEDILRDRWQAFGQEIPSELTNGNTTDTPVYQEDTQHLRNRVRTSFRVPTQRIRDYYQDLLGQERVEEGLRSVLKYNDHLVFLLEDEAVIEPPNDNDEFLIMSRPPGMENLGATCYLNTQLQCLAQNLSFVEGILSYQSNGDDRMSDIMRQFQNLLRDMTLGPWNEINTVSFTQSLGLDHAEQQDPNEFSRLFLDKLHTSFRQHKDEADELLPFLFQGIQQYETTCTGCGTVSSRPEQFMDLNLPIINKKNGTGSVLEMISDPSVQDCFEDAYAKEETLEGDNQYFCDTCNGKRNATRKVAFQKLPPVLNIQLSRYVYNMQTFMKQKVEQPVLLNTDFRIKDRKYRLVAVMRHKGRSAYHGHYIAEAMDWCTGLWYEFNDTAVTWLEDGPRNASTTKSSKKIPAGSSEAYNMYYVEEDFLSQSVWEACLRRTRLYHLPLYRDLQKMCDRDQKIWKALQDRKKCIHDKLNLFQKLNSSSVWIDNDSWKQFVECQTDTIASYQICPHKQGLSPRQARQGKLVPASVYEVYCELTNQQFDASTVFTPKSQLFCDECTSEYQKQLAAKVQLVETAQRVLHVVQQNSPEPTDVDDPYTFVVSRKFITSFKGDMAKLVKAIIAANDDLDDVEVSSFFGEGVVNQCITCEHGSCEITNKRRIMQIPRSIWTCITQLYPFSVEHERLFQPEDDTDYACPQCSAASTALDTRREYLSELLRFKVDVCSLSDVIMRTDEDEAFSFRVIHSEDWAVWNRFLRAAKSQMDGGAISEQAKDVLKPANPWDCEKYTSIQKVSGSTADFLSRTMHPFACRAHGLPLESALFIPNQSPRRLNQDKLLILGETAYHNLTNHWERVTREVLVTEADAEATSPVQWLHPSFRRRRQASDLGVVISSDQVSMLFTPEGQFCEDVDCNSGYCSWLKKCKVPGSAAHEPIAIDIDMDAMALPGVSLSVFEVEPGTTVETFVADKESATEESSTELLQSLRRSTRSRKSRYPKGCILSEQSLKINLQSNLAALRLLFLERCTAGNPFEVSHTIQFIVPPDETQGGDQYRLIDLPLDKSSDKLEDLISEGLETPFADIPTSVVCRISVTRQALDMVGDMPKEALLDHFMNLSSDVQPTRKKRRVERGFTGTFLSSAQSNQNDGVDNDLDDNDSMLVERGSNKNSDTTTKAACEIDDSHQVEKSNSTNRRSISKNNDDANSDNDSIQVVEAVPSPLTNNNNSTLSASSSSKQTDMPARTGLITVDSSDDDEDELLHGRPVFQNVAESSKNASDPTRQRRKVRQRINELVRRLIETPEVDNETNVRMAAEKAIQEQPDLPMDDLLMYAYCQYSEIQSSS